MTRGFEEDSDVYRWVQRSSVLWVGCGRCIFIGFSVCIWSQNRCNVIGYLLIIWSCSLVNLKSR